jgi:hypothetical protein
MQCEVAGAGVEHGRPLQGIGIGAVKARHFRAEGLVGQPIRHAIVDGVDHPADGLAAIPQRGGSSDHLDPLRRQGIDGHSVIRPDLGHIEAADTVFQRTHPVGVETTNHRPARAGRE